MTGGFDKRIDGIDFVDIRLDGLGTISTSTGDIVSSNIKRIKFNTSASDTGAYVLILNPKEVDYNERSNAPKLSILNGGSLIQKKVNNTKPIILTWTNIPKTFKNFTTMLNTLQTYVNKIRYVNFADIDKRVYESGWTKVRVKDLNVKIKDATNGGKIKYNVELILSRIP